jgi:hypothetical protein
LLNTLDSEQEVQCEAQSNLNEEKVMSTMRNGMFLLCVCLMFLTIGCRTTTIDILFVMSAESGSYNGERLTLNGVQKVLFFSDRPARNSGDMELGKFLKNWEIGKDSFQNDPPNAVLSIFNDSGATNVVLELMNPSIPEQGTIDYEVRVLKGELPDSFRVASLFIDWIVNKANG